MAERTLQELLRQIKERETKISSINEKLDEINEGLKKLEGLHGLHIEMQRSRYLSDYVRLTKERSFYLEELSGLKQTYERERRSIE